MVRTAALALALCFAAPAAAQQSMTVQTGNGFLALCDDDDDFGGVLVCSGYVMGLADRGAHSFPPRGVVAEDNRYNEYCPPAEATYRQYMDIMLEYLRRNPARRHFGTPLIFILAMADAWPCPNGPNIDVLPFGAIATTPRQP